MTYSVYSSAFFAAIMICSSPYINTLDSAQRNETQQELLPPDTSGPDTILEGDNIASTFDRDWSFDIVSTRIGSAVKVKRVISEPIDNTSSLQGSINLTERRNEAELFWYQDVYAQCSGNTVITAGTPRQEPALMTANNVLVTTYGDIISLDDGQYLLDTLAMGACHRAMRRRSPPKRLVGRLHLPEIFVLSQPWGHAIAHTILECLPKVMMALHELQLHSTMALHISQAHDDEYAPQLEVERVKTLNRIDEYLAAVGLGGRTLVHGLVTASVAYFVSPTRCIIAQPPLLRRMRVAMLPHIGLETHALEQTSLLRPTRDGQVLVVRRSCSSMERRCLHPQWEVLMIQALHQLGLNVVVYDNDDGWDAKTILAAFAHVDAVVAPHGAGLANLIVSKRGTHVLEFHPSEPRRHSSGIPGVNLCFLHLARTLGMKYTGALMWPSHRHDFAWESDIEIVLEWAKALVAAKKVYSHDEQIHTNNIMVNSNLLINP